jgi:hypothetical protein
MVGRPYLSALEEDMGVRWGMAGAPKKAVGVHILKVEDEVRESL